MKKKNLKDKIISPTGLALAAAYKQLSLMDVIKLAKILKIPINEVKYELYVLERQGNIMIKDGRLVIPATAHRLTHVTAQNAAQYLFDT